jgi:hypothetical protein
VAGFELTFLDWFHVLLRTRKEKIAIVIAQALDAYKGVLTSEQLRLEHLATVMDMQCRAMGGGPSVDGSDEGEIALLSFSGICFYASKKDTELVNAPTDRQQQVDRHNKEVQNQNVHIAINKGIWKPNVGKSLATSIWSHNGSETRSKLQQQWLKAESMSRSYCQLWHFQEHNHCWTIQICGSVTPHAEDLCEVRKPNASDSITMGNGMHEMAQKIGHIPGTICDKYGNQVMDVKREDWKRHSDSRHTVQSVHHLQTSNWRMDYARWQEWHHAYNTGQNYHVWYCRTDS